MPGQLAIGDFAAVATLQVLLVLGIIGYGFAADDSSKVYGGFVALLLELFVAAVVWRARRTTAEPQDASR